MNALQIDNESDSEFDDEFDYIDWNDDIDRNWQPTVTETFVRRRAGLIILRALIRASGSHRDISKPNIEYVTRKDWIDEHHDKYFIISEFIVWGISRAAPEERERLFDLMRGCEISEVKIFKRFAWVVPINAFNPAHWRYYH